MIPHNWEACYLQLLLEMARSHWHYFILWTEWASTEKVTSVLYFVECLEQKVFNRRCIEDTWVSAVCDFIESTVTRIFVYVFNRSLTRLNKRETCSPQKLILVEESARSYVGAERINNEGSNLCGKVLGIEEHKRLSGIHGCSVELRTASVLEKASEKHVEIDAKVDVATVKIDQKRAEIRGTYKLLKKLNQIVTIYWKLIRNTWRGSVIPEGIAITKIGGGPTDGIGGIGGVSGTAGVSGTGGVRGTEGNSGTDGNKGTDGISGTDGKRDTDGSSVKLYVPEQASDNVPLHEDTQNCVDKCLVAVNVFKNVSDSQALISNVIFATTVEKSDEQTCVNNIKNQRHISKTEVISERTRSIPIVDNNKWSSSNVGRSRSHIKNNYQYNQQSLIMLDNYPEPDKVQASYSIGQDKDFPVTQSNLGTKNVLENITHVRYLPSCMKNNVFVYMFTVQPNASVPSNIHGIPWKEFDKYATREASFACYPSSSIMSKTLLASSGFVYIGGGVGDRVKCYTCYVEKEKWRTDEDVYDTHRRLSPNCPMALSNTPLNVSTRHTSEARSCSATPSVPTPVQIQDFPNSKNSYELLTSTSSSSGPITGLLCQRDRKRRNSASSMVHATQTRASHSDPIVNHTYIDHNHSFSSYQPHGVCRNAAPSSNVLPTASGSQSNQTATRATATGDPSRSNSVHSRQNSMLTQSFRSNLHNTETERYSPATVSQFHIASNDPRVSASSDSVSFTNTSLASIVSIHPPSTSRAQKTPIYEDLGIVIAKPKYPEFACLRRRLETFGEYPANHPVKPEDIARAGMMYIGKEDCCRCFYCGGGLRHWETGDDPRVEHARWFHKCGYIRQYVGLDFVNAVQELKPICGTITFEDVETHMKKCGKTSNTELAILAIKNDPAVLSLVSEGYNEEQVVQVADELKKSGVTLSADVVLNRLYRKVWQSSDNMEIESKDEDDADTNNEALRNLKEQNYSIRKNKTCKVCWDKEVEIVFLPCGHLVSCLECAVILQICPLCRTFIKGRVRTYLQ